MLKNVSFIIRIAHYVTFFILLADIFNLTDNINCYAYTGKEKTEIFVTSKESNSQLQHTKSIENNLIDIDKLKKFNLKAFIEPIKNKKSGLYKKKQIVINDKNIVCNKTLCTKRLSLDILDKNISIDELPHVMLEFEQSSSELNPKIFLQLEIASKGPKNELIPINGYFDFNSKISTSPQVSIDLEGAVYKKRSTQYVIKRQLGLKADQKWYYTTQKEKDLILQSRVDLPVKNNHAVKLFFDSNCLVKAVNFSIDSDGNGIKDNYIHFDQTQHTEEINNNQRIITIDLRKKLSDLQVNINNARLIEPIIFLETSIQEYLKEKPLKKIVFCEAIDPVEGKIIQKGEKTYFEFDFSDTLKNHNLIDKQVSQAEVVITFDEFQTLSLETITFYDTIDYYIPAIGDMPNKMLRNWIGNSPDLPPFNHITSFHPLWMHLDLSSLLWSSEISKANEKERLARITYNNNFYNKEDWGDRFVWRWMINDGMIMFDDAINSVVSIKFNAFSFLRKRDLDIFLNGNFLKRIKVGIERKQYILNNIVLKGGDQAFLFQTPDGTDNINEILKSGDMRNVSIAFSEFEITPLYHCSAQNNTPPLKIEWKSRNNKINGKVYNFITGLDINFILNAKISLEQNNNNKVVSSYFEDTSGWMKSDFESGTIIKNIKFDKAISNIVSKKGFSITLFDVETEEINNASDYNTFEWWIKEAVLSLDINKIKNSNKVIVKKDRIFFVNDNSKKKWSFELSYPDEEYIMPVSLLFPGPIPQPCKAKIWINDAEIIIPRGFYEIPVHKFKKNDNSSIKFQIEYFGDKPILSLSKPMLKVFGLKRTAKDDIKNLGVRINGKRISNQISNLPSNEGNWFDLGSVTLDAGNHSIEIDDSPYFYIKTLVLNTESPKAMKEVQKDNTNIMPVWKKISKLITKLFILICNRFGDILIVVLLYATYIFRESILSWFKLILLSVWNMFSKAYCILSPDRYWMILWGMSGAFLYKLGTSYPNSGENYFYTFGGIAMVLAYWHMSKVYKERLFIQFPRLAENIFSSVSTPFFAGALILLISTAGLFVFQFESIAEQVSIIIYYFLVVGIVAELISIKQNKKNEIK